MPEEDLDEQVLATWLQQPRFGFTFSFQDILDILDGCSIGSVNLAVK